MSLRSIDSDRLERNRVQRRLFYSILANIYTTTHLSIFKIIRVNVEDELELRELFFGEAQGSKNYAVLCHDGENSKVPVSSVFQDANNDGTAPAEFRLLDCNHLLKDSEKTVADRFKLNLKTRPTIFVSGIVGPPKQVRSVEL
jgi:hypothetical protein